MSPKDSFQMISWARWIRTTPLSRSLFSQGQQIYSQGRQVSSIKHKLQGPLELRQVQCTAPWGWPGFAGEGVLWRAFSCHICFLLSKLLTWCISTVACPLSQLCVPEVWSQQQTWALLDMSVCISHELAQLSPFFHFTLEFFASSLEPPCEDQTVVGSNNLFPAGKQEEYEGTMVHPT